MAVPSALNFNAIERDCETILNENDSGVFSDTTVHSQLPIYISRHGNNGSKPSRKFHAPNTKNPIRRLIRKSGKPNIIRTKIPYLRTAYIRDLGNTLVNSRWKWTLLCFASSYVLCWLIFALFYMLIAQDNNDISETDPSEYPCLMGISGFAGYFLFSLETQHTIGYGTRYITSNCPEGTFLISVQMIVSIAICGAMASIVYTKMVRPLAMPTQTLFSKTAIICQRDGMLCLIFRVRDTDNKHRVGTQIHAYLVQRRNEEPFLKTLTLEKPGFLLWPLEIVHHITPSSPFWDLSAKDLITRRFELIVTMQGTSVTTGQCSKTRTSYLTSEILWGHRFKPCIKFDNENQVYYVDPTDFNTTEEVLTPLCSAKRLHEVVEEISSTISTPIWVKSPMTQRYKKTFNDDEESFSASSGIGSFQEVPSPILNSNPINAALRKLSTISELNSSEDVKVKMSNENLKDQNENSVKIEEVSSTRERSPAPYVMNADERISDYAQLNEIDGKHPQKSLRNSGNFDVEALVASLQNYIFENEGASRTTPRFNETDF